MSLQSDSCRRLDAGGWLTGVNRIDSPNHDARPIGTSIRLIVIHAISLPPGEFGGDRVADLFLNRLNPSDHPYFAEIADRRVSAHFFVGREGAITQFVACRERAWHAGVSCWQGRERCNDFSLGIELEGDDHSIFTEMQYRALDELLSVLTACLPIEAIVGHADIAAGRKTDPGPCFDWSRLVALQTHA